MSAPNESTQLDDLLEDAVLRLRRGESVSLVKLCDQHPDLADDLRMMLPAMALLEKPTVASATAEFEEHIPAKLADFQVLREIGRGGMGRVFEALQTTLGRRVALKVLPLDGAAENSCRDRFCREAQIAAQLHHTNIIPIFEAGQADGIAFYAMQLIEGADLRQILGGSILHPHGKHSVPRTGENAETCDELETTQGKIPADSDNANAITIDNANYNHSPPRMLASEAECVRVALQVAEGLEFAHQQGVLHRDIKPANIMLDKEGRAWIADFGLAKPLQSSDLTATGDVVGTIRYLAPERFRGAADCRSDVYGLGLTLFEMLEGKPAFEDVDRARLIHKILHGPVPQLSGSRIPVSRDLRKVVAKAIAREPADRYQRAGELAEDLRRFLGGFPVLARRPPLFEQLYRWAGRNPLPATLAGTTAMALILGAIASLILAVQWRAASRRESANAMAAINSAKEVKSASDRLQNSLDLTTDALSELTSTVVSEYLASRDSLSTQQKNFLQKIVGYNEQLLALSGSDVRSRRHRAEALQQIAEIRQLLGERSQSLQEILAAIDAWQALAVDFPQESDFVFEVYHSTNMLGKFLAEDKRHSEALLHFEKAREILSGLQSKGHSIERELPIVDINIANLMQIRGDFPAAVEKYQSAIDSLRSLLKANPNSLPNRESLCKGLNNLALTFMKTGLLDQARIAGLEASDHRRELAEQDLNDIEAQWNYEESLAVVGRIESEAKEFRVACERFTLALEIAKQLATTFPSVPKYRQAQGQNSRNLAYAFAKLGQIKDSERFEFEAIETWEKLAAEFPDSTYYCGELATAQLAAAELLMDLRAEEAQSLAASAVSLRRTLIGRVAPESAATSNFELVQALNLLGLIHWLSLKGPADALPHFQEADEICQRLVAESPHNREVIVFHAGVRCNIGRVLTDVNQPAEAMPFLNSAIRDIVPIYQSQPSFPSAQEHLSKCYLARAFAQSDLDNDTASIADWEQVFELTTEDSTRCVAVINIALRLARGGQTDRANQLAVSLIEVELTSTQRRYLARIFVILANQTSDDTARDKLLADAARQLEIAHRDGPAAVLKLADDNDFKKFWDRISPTQ